MVNQSGLFFEQFKDSLLTFSPFVIKKTGILQNQTILKIDSYSLICVPYQISMQFINLILPLSKDEVNFFSKYKASLAGLTLVFQEPNTGKEMKLFARCVLNSITNIKGKENVGMITVVFKPTPQDIILILGSYFSSLEQLKIEYEDYKDKMIQITPENAKQLAYNNYSLLTIGDATLKLALYSIASNKLDLLLPPQTIDIAVGSKGTVKLFFQRYQFSVACELSSWNRLPTGVVRAALSLDFSPELIEILELFNFQKRIIARKQENPVA